MADSDTGVWKFVKSFDDKGGHFILKALFLAFLAGGIYFLVQQNRDDISTLKQGQKNQNIQIRDNSTELSNNQVRWRQLNDRLDRIEQNQKQTMKDIKELIKKD